jgi:hypothetical protein
MLLLAVGELLPLVEFLAAAAAQEQQAEQIIGESLLVL